MGLARLSVSTVVVVWLLVVAGGIVRVTGSGMGCGPDWPLCNGQVVPVFQLETLIEFVHRLVAAGGSVLALATIYAAWHTRRHEPWIARPAIAAGLVLLVQIVLGAITVMLELASTVVTVHLAVAAVLLALLTVIATVASTQQRVGVAGRHDRLFGLALLTTGATFVLILIGSYMMGVGAGLGCTTFPLCNGGYLLPPGQGAQIHMLHRLAAGLVGLLVLATFVQAWRSPRRDRSLSATAGLVGVIYVSQVLVGIATVVFIMPPALRVAHLALAFALWATLVALCVLARPRSTETAALASDTAGDPGSRPEVLSLVARGKAS